MRIIELFKSIQGEGQRTGRPSIFIRTGGCNLRCMFGKSICDTPHSSFNPDESKYGLINVGHIITENPQIQDIVITGGEPLIQKDLDSLVDYIKNINPFLHITIENNGTIMPSNYLMEMVDLWSISPKLSTSEPKVSKKYGVTKEQVEYHKSHRINKDVLDKLSNECECQFKFVYSGMDSIIEILDIIDNTNIVKSQILLMPEGTTNKQLTKLRKETIEMCVKYGFVYCERVHIVVWDDLKCV